MKRTENDNAKESLKNPERPVVAFWNKHRREIITTTGIVAAVGSVILTAFGVKYYWNATAFDRWFKKASLDELKTARNNIHSEYLKYTVNDEYRKSLWNLLPILDKRIDEIAGIGKIPSGPSYPREHGHNLYKPD